MADEIVDEIAEVAQEAISMVDGTTPTAEEETPEPVVEEPSEPELLAGAFKNPEELAKGYEELKVLLDRQGSELGELRKLRDDLQQSQQAAQAPRINQETVDWFEEQAYQNPGEAAVWSLQHDPSGVLYSRAMDIWYEEDPRTAAAFERRLEQEQANHGLIQNLMPLLQPLLQQQQRNEFAEIADTIASQHADFAQVGPKMYELAKEHPFYKGVLENTSLDGVQKKAILESLFYEAKGRLSESLPVVAQEAATSAAVQSQAAKLAAQIASPSISGPQSDDENLSAGDRWLRDLGFDEALKQFQG